MLFLKILDKFVKGCREEDFWFVKMLWKFFEDLVYFVSCLVIKLKRGEFFYFSVEMNVLKRF